MQIRQIKNKILCADLSTQERMWVRRNAVNVTSKDAVLILEDNIFNRVLLSLNISEITRDICDFDCSVNENAREYQKRDIAQITSSKYALNCNKPGYGKTFESIEYCRLKNLKRILVVCPKSVVTQWEDQFKLWWPEVAQDVMIWGDGPQTRERIIYVTNYEQLAFRSRRDPGKRKKELIPTQIWQKCKQWTWDVIICDESHRIKSATAQTTMAIKQLPSVRRLALTGTPILNHPDDLWSQLNFLDVHLSGASYWAFVERFCELEEDNFGKKPVGLTPSEGARDLLTKVLALISVGGENYKVTEGKNYIPIELHMTPEQRNIYKDIVNLSLERLEEVGITVKNAMDQIIKQQQLTTNCGKFSCKVNPKFDWIRDWLEDNEDEPIVVYTKFAETAKALAKYLDSKKITNKLFIGELTPKGRAEAKDAFVQQRARVLIGTIGALGTGVDGLQYVCDNVIFLDRDWTPGINEQAEDRVNRSGHVGMTNIWILNMKHSIDEYVDKIQGRKADDIREVFTRVANNYGT